MTSAVARIRPSESQSRAVYGDGSRSSVALYADVRKGIDWFRTVWQDVMQGMEIHRHAIADEDAWGAPDFTERFRRYLDRDLPDPAREAWAAMFHSSSIFERCYACFLFALACRDFDPEAAGLAMGGRCICRPACPSRAACPLPTAPIYFAYATPYAEKAIARLQECMARLPQRERPSGARSVQRPAWMLGVWDGGH